MTAKRNFYIVLITLFTLILAGAIVTALVIPDLVFDKHIWIVIFIVGFMADTFLLSMVVVFLVSQRITLSNLRRENEYNIHRNNTFYNLHLFDRTLYRRRKYLLKNEGYMISLSPIKVGNLDIAANHHLVADLNGFISDFIYQYLTLNRKDLNLKYKEVCYCYNHGVFLIYLVCNQEKIDQVTTDIENEIYAIAKREDIRVFVQPSFGIAKTDERSTAYKLINRANHARQVAEKNFETITYFNKESMVKKAAIDPNEILEAIKNDEFVIYYQPKYHLASKRFISSEALLRWDSPKYGLLAPYQFISAIESSGLIHQIDTYVFEKVCKDFLENKKKGRRALPCSINFSLYEFYSPGFVDDVFRIVEQYGVNPALIEIEITETTSSANSFLAISILKKFKDYGFKILMDDFGVGFSNLQSLKKLPIDVVKIDKSFIDDIVIDARSREVVKFLIAFCKANNLEVVAEGVEDIAQVNILKHARCDMIQGYYYSKPISKRDFDKFLSSNEFERKEFI